MNNSAITGGVFVVESKSLVSIHDSIITNNFALEAGVVKAHINGYFEFDNTTITQNYALSVPVGDLVDGALISNVTNSRIFNNQILPIDSFKTTLNYLPADFIDYLDRHPSFLDIIPSEYSFKLIQANLRIDSGTQVTNQSAIVD